MSEDRPALSEIMVALMADGVKAVRIEKLVRLAGDLMIQETLVADFRKNASRSFLRRNQTFAAMTQAAY